MRKILLLLFLIGSTFSVKAQLFGKHWDEGYYYDKDSKKTSGFFADYLASQTILGTKGHSFLFKPDTKSEKVKISLDDIVSLIVKSDSASLDSFVVTKDTLLIKNPLLLVVFNNSTKLYAQLTIKRGVNYDMLGKKWYYGTDPNNIKLINGKNFISVMSEIIADKPAVVKNIKAKRLTLSHMDEIIDFVKKGYSPLKPTGY